MNRIEKRLEELKQENKKAFITRQSRKAQRLQRFLIWLRVSAKKNVRFQLCS